MSNPSNPESGTTFCSACGESIVNGRHNLGRCAVPSRFVKVTWTDFDGISTCEQLVERSALAEHRDWVTFDLSGTNYVVSAR